MLHLRNVTKQFDEKTIIRSVSMTVESGQVLALLGPNGAGKTTLIKLIMGLLTPENGEIHVNGLSIVNRRAFLTQIGYVPDEPFFYDELTGREFIQFTADLWGKNFEQQQAETIREVAESLQAEDFLSEPIHTYSLGMKKKLSIIIATMRRPKLLIMDEPLNGLDPMTIYAIKQFIRGYAASGGTLIMSTHLMDIAETMCSHIAILNKGEVVAHDSIEFIKTQSGKTLEEYFMDQVAGR